MKKTWVNILFLLSTATQSFCATPNAVTYKLNGGRLGDNLLSYCHARWIAYKYEIPFVYRPFHYSDQLLIHGLHPNYRIVQNQFQKFFSFPCNTVNTRNILDFIKENDVNTLYIVRFFTERKKKFHVDWNDQSFVDILRKEIAPRKRLTSLNLPKHLLKVAVHVRTGGGYDKVLQDRIYDNMPLRSSRAYSDKSIPLRFPPDSFYIEQIKRMSELLEDQPLYVHIFTDSPNSKKMVEYYKSMVNKPNITYACREENNSHNQNVLEDFFALTQFDYLIRADSHFSLMASKLGNFKIVIHPAKHEWDGDTLKITEVKTIIDPNSQIAS